MKSTFAKDAQFRMISSQILDFHQDLRFHLAFLDSESHSHILTELLDFGSICHILTVMLDSD